MSIRRRFRGLTWGWGWGIEGPSDWLESDGQVRLESILVEFGGPQEVTVVLAVRSDSRWQVTFSGAQEFLGSDVNLKDALELTEFGTWSSQGSPVWYSALGDQVSLNIREPEVLRVRRMQ